MGELAKTCSQPHAWHGSSKRQTGHEVAGVYPRIMSEGDMDAGAWVCGMVAGMINDIPTCQELIGRIMGEAEAIIHERLSGFSKAG